MDLFEIEGAQVTVEELHPDGHAAKGWIFTDPQNAYRVATATYVHVMPGDRYDVTANPHHRVAASAPSRGGSTYDLASAVRMVKDWVSESKQKTEV